MAAGGVETTYEERVRMHGLWSGLLLLAALAMIGQAAYMAYRFWYITSHGGVCDVRPGAFTGAVGLVLALVWLAFRALNIRVDEEQVRFWFGPFGVRIPRDRVERAEACHYSWTSYGGWGIRGGFDGSYAYNVPGDGGRGVRITYKNAKGRRRTALISSRRPDVLADAITAVR